MSSQDKPKLQQLAMEKLMKNEDLTIHRLNSHRVPTRFFPAIFQEAFINRKTKIVKAMVINWPFHCLPLGTLMGYAHADNFQAVLDGLDWLIINQDDWPMRCNLQVLNLHDIYQDFWEGCVVKQDDEDSNRQSKPEETDSKTETKRKPIEVLAEYSLVHDTLKDYTSSFMRWLKQRKDIINIYFCRLEPKNKSK